MPAHALPPADDHDQTWWPPGINEAAPGQSRWCRTPTDDGESHPAGKLSHEPGQRSTSAAGPRTREPRTAADHGSGHGFGRRSCNGFSVEADDGTLDMVDVEPDDGFGAGPDDGFAVMMDEVPGDGPAGGSWREVDPLSERQGSAASGRWATVGAAVDVARRHLAVLLVAGVVAVGMAATYLFRAHDTTVALPTSSMDGSAASASRRSESRASSPESASPRTSAGVASPPASAASSAAATVTVQVLGPVRRPGVVTLRQGARVKDAVAACGGLLPDADPAELNLAAVLSDASQVVIGTRAHPRGELRTGPDAAALAATVPSTGSSASTGTVNLNTATAAELDTLPGVGPSTAQRILDWRAQHGRFTSVSELQEIDGIGPKTYARLAPHVRV